MKSDTSPEGPDLRFEPQEIAIKDASAQVVITWGDDHVSAYPIGYLRGFCPCAVCQGHGGPLTFQKEGQNSALKLNTLEAVGHYAITIQWNDGHKTGIYTLDALRNMCPCAACQKGPLGRTMIKLLPEALRATLQAPSER